MRNLPEVSVEIGTGASSSGDSWFSILAPETIAHVREFIAVRVHYG